MRGGSLGPLSDERPIHIFPESLYPPLGNRLSHLAKLLFRRWRRWTSHIYVQSNLEMLSAIPAIRRGQSGTSFGWQLGWQPGCVK